MMYTAISKICFKCSNEFEVDPKAQFYRCSCGHITDLWYSPSPKTGRDESVNHPAHYNQGKIEVIEFIEDKELGFHLGNAIKYISRAGKKDPSKTVEDLKKAVWYIERQIELFESRTTGRETVRPNNMRRET